MKLEMDDNTKAVVQHWAGAVIVTAGLVVFMFWLAYIIMASQRAANEHELNMAKAGMIQKTTPTSVGTATVWVKADDRERIKLEAGK